MGFTIAEEAEVKRLKRRNSILKTANDSLKKEIQSIYDGTGKEFTKQSFKLDDGSVWQQVIDSNGNVVTKNMNDGRVRNHKHDDDIKKGNLEDAPYIRTSLDAPFDLTDDWQDVPYLGSSGLNANTFPIVGQKKAVYYDTVNKIFNFEVDALRTFRFEFDFVLDSSLFKNGVEFRFYIPTADIAFPNPFSKRMHNLVDLERNDIETIDYIKTVRSEQSIIDNGLKVQLRATKPFVIFDLNQVTLTDASLSIYAGI